MSKSLVRSLIAGSVSAVASLTLFAIPAAHAAGQPAGVVIECIPVFTDHGNGTGTLAYPDDCNPGVPAVDGLDPAVINGTSPAFVPQHAATELCDLLDLTNLDVRAAQTSPDNWQWRFAINGSTKYLCNDTVVVTMTDLNTGITEQHSFTLFNIVNANALGSDFISSWATPCNYTTTVQFGAALTQIAQYADQHKQTAECIPPAVSIPDTPEDPQTPRTPDTPQVPGDNLPHTGSDTTALLTGFALLVVGAGLGFTALSMTRRRHHV